MESGSNPDRSTVFVCWFVSKGFESMRISKNHGRTVITLSAMEKRHLETVQDVQATVVALGGDMKDFNKCGVLVIEPMLKDFKELDDQSDDESDDESDGEIPGLNDDKTVASISKELSGK